MEKEKQDKIQESERMKVYFKDMDKLIREAYKIAEEAKKKGFDPSDKVEVPSVKNMAERVEGLVSVVAPEIIGSGISERIKELEQIYGSLDWRISLIIAEEIAKGKFCKFKDKKEAMEVGIRVGFAYHTMGSVASPIEGFVEFKINKTKDGKEYFDIYYAGPIRSAGGTGASVSVLIVDYVRIKMGYSPYDPSEEEIKRTVTELYDYHERITNLQYLPSEKEIEFMTRHLPVQINGDGSEKIEVSNYKDLDRIKTNRIRNGVCLVLGEGLCQKAPKLWKQLSKWGKDFGLEHWNFIGDFVKLQKEIKAKSSAGKEEKGKDKKNKIQPDYTFIKDIVAGRPVITHPLRVGGFRLRYGRSRTSGYSAASMHPATMVVLDDFIATGTQLKLERPGKAASMTCCDCMDGPIVKLKNGSIVKLDSEKEALNVRKEIEEIIFLGDILICFGDFLNRAHKLVPPGYCEEWWVQQFEKATVDVFGSLDISKLSELIGIEEEEIEILLSNPINTKISAYGARIISEKLNIPLHPEYIYYWKTIDFNMFSGMIEWLKKSKVEKESGIVQKIIIPNNENKRTLEVLGVPHTLINDEFVVIEKEHAIGFSSNIQIENLQKYSDDIKNKDKYRDVLEVINKNSEFIIQDKAGIFIGARMGRPEKAKMRKLNGSPHTLFPIGEEGGRLRSFQSALKIGEVTGEFPIYQCKKCDTTTIYQKCDTCGKQTKQMYYCRDCNKISDKECQLKKKNNPEETHTSMTYKRQKIDIKKIFSQALNNLNMRLYPDLIKGVRGTSNKDHTPENLVKGILRAKHDIYVNKDGTTRYDMTQLPLTHFKPNEIRTSIEKLREMGYEYDINGKQLESPEQILEIKPQDVVLPSCPDSPNDGADKVLLNIANFIDDLLVNLYGLQPYYNLKNEMDIVGHLVLAQAPHTSAGIIARVIGFSKTQGFLAHPVIHAATRRDCDGDEASICLLLDVLINFSRKFLPAHRGSTQDAPLVLTSKVIPSEIDDMIFDMDIAWKYDLDFYNACKKYSKPWEAVVEKFGDFLKSEKQYEGHGFTHDNGNINDGVICSSYKILPSMEEKLNGQMRIAERLRAVDERDVATFVIEKHFIKDTKGNLRKFSMQKFRCVKCNEIYRRPPLIGKCTKCDGRIIFTISEGSVVKYFESSMNLADKYNVPAYLKQSLELLKRRIEGVFGKDKERQEGLGKWFG